MNNFNFYFYFFVNFCTSEERLCFKVNCMEVILEEGGATISSKPFASNLRWFFGVVAVGTLGGHLYLIDLR